MVKETRHSSVVSTVGVVALILMMIIIPTSATIVQYQISTSGDHISLASDVAWMSGDEDVAAGDILDHRGVLDIGSYSTKMLARGSYSSAGKLDTSSYNGYEYQTEADIGGIYRESILVDSYGCLECQSTEENPCSPENSTRYNTGATFSSRVIGGDVSIDSKGTALQTDGKSPDRLIAGISVSGSGLAEVKFSSINLFAAGGDYDTGYKDEQKFRTSTDGPNMQLSAVFDWTSFRSLYPTNVETPEETG